MVNDFTLMRGAFAVASFAIGLVALYLHNYGAMALFFLLGVWFILQKDPQ
jgi:uncharacterized membrane protein HdeD (DUF308 family)